MLTLFHPLALRLVLLWRTLSGRGARLTQLGKPVMLSSHPQLITRVLRCRLPPVEVS